MFVQNPPKSSGFTLRRASSATKWVFASSLNQKMLILFNSSSLQEKQQQKKKKLQGQEKIMRVITATGNRMPPLKTASCNAITESSIFPFLLHNLSHALLFP